MKKLLILFLIVLTTNLMALPPEPPLGYRWILNNKLSDEFNGDTLDLVKWYNYHPGWLGRVPAMFHPDMVSVKDGMLQIKNQKLDKDTVIYHSWNNDSSIYSIAGGAVVSRTQSAFYGYYECSMKANKTLMSSTFWLSGNGADGPAACADNYSLELDIQECVGRPHNTNSSFHTGMHSNTHYWYTDCDGASHDYKKGNQFDTDLEVSDTFHIYAAHWIDSEQATFLLNNKQERTINFPTDASPTPFDRPMQINMVTETYDWVGVPTDEELADDSKNTTYYDWIRSYKLLGIDEIEEEPVLIQNGGFETGDFTYWAGWGGDPREVVSTEVHSGTYAAHIKGGGAPEYVANLKPNTDYTLSCFAKVISGSISFGIKENGGDQVVMGTTTISANTDYEKQEIVFTTNSNSAFKLYFYAPGSGDEGYADDFLLEETYPSIDPEENYSVFTEAIEIIDYDDAFTNTSEVSAIVQYKLNSAGKIIASMIDSEGNIVGTSIVDVLIGYAHGTYDFGFDAEPAVDIDYTIKLELFNDKDELIDTESFVVSTKVSATPSLNSDMNDLVIYPNPSAEIVYVQSLAFNKSYMITNLAGETVLMGILNARQSINLSSLSSGNYILYVKDLGSVQIVKY